MKLIGMNIIQNPWIPDGVDVNYSLPHTQSNIILANQDMLMYIHYATFKGLVRC